MHVDAQVEILLSRVFLYLNIDGIVVEKIICLPLDTLQNETI